MEEGGLQGHTTVKELHFILSFVIFVSTFICVLLLSFVFYLVSNRFISFFYSSAMNNIFSNECTVEPSRPRVISPHRTFSDYILTEIATYTSFTRVQAVPNLLQLHLYLHRCRGNKVCRVLMHLFGVVQAHRTFSNHIITVIARCLEFCHMSSGWFDHTEPSLSTSLQGKQGVQGAYALVQAHRTSSNLPEPHHYRDSKVCRVLSHEFGVVRPYRTFSIRRSKVYRVLMH